MRLSIYGAHLRSVSGNKFVSVSHFKGSLLVCVLDCDMNACSQSPDFDLWFSL